MNLAFAVDDTDECFECANLKRVGQETRTYLKCIGCKNRGKHEKTNSNCRDIDNSSRNK